MRYFFFLAVHKGGKKKKRLNLQLSQLVKQMRRRWEQYDQPLGSISIWMVSGVPQTPAGETWVRWDEKV